MFYEQILVCVMMLFWSFHMPFGGRKEIYFCAMPDLMMMMMIVTEHTYSVVTI